MFYSRDTDSVILLGAKQASQLNQNPLPIGTLLGQFKDEIEGGIIDSFFGLSAKCYEIKYRSLPIDGDGDDAPKLHYITKIRGFQLKSEESLRAMMPGQFKEFTQNYLQRQISSALIPQFRFLNTETRGLQSTIITKALNNDMYDKRAIVANINDTAICMFTLPYGYSQPMLRHAQKLEQNILNNQ